MYEWDPAKAERNATIHGVIFKQATVALEDANAVYLPDRVVEDELWHRITRQRRRSLFNDGGARGARK